MNYTRPKNVIKIKPIHPSNIKSVLPTYTIQPTPFSLVGLCISYQYIDTLQYMLPINHIHFDKIYIVTQEDDLQTIQFCKHFNNVEVIFFNFKNNGKRFDKYGALNLIQSIAYREFPSSWYLNIDSDIILPTNFKELMNTQTLNPDCIYGCVRANCIKSSDIINFDPMKEVRKYPFNNVLFTRRPCIIGYFQLYKKKVFHNLHLTNAAEGDVYFCNHFKLICNLNMLIIHLGDSCKNWNGKTQDFILDIPLTTEHLQFTSILQPKYYKK